MVQITISSSLRYIELVRKLITDFENIGINAVFPNIDCGVKKEDVNLDFMKKLEKDHFDAINQSNALYVVCPEGNIGTLVSVEIGYAYAKGKIIIFSSKPDDLGLQAIANNYINLDQLDKIKKIIKT